MHKIKQPSEWKNNLFNARWKAHISQEQLGRIIGVKRQYIQQMEDGSKPIPDYRLEQLATVFGMSVNELFPEPTQVNIGGGSGE